MSSQRTAHRFAHTQILTLDAPPERVFPLFGPIREKEWAADWDPTLVWSESDLGDHAGTIFTSRHAGQPDTIWYVNCFDHAHHTVEYLRVTPGLYLAVVAIRCDAAADGKTAAAVTYTFTAFSAAGAAALHEIAAHHPQSVAAWEAMINQTLRAI